MPLSHFSKVDHLPKDLRSLKVSLPNKNTYNRGIDKVAEYNVNSSETAVYPFGKKFTMTGSGKSLNAEILCVPVEEAL